MFFKKAFLLGFYILFTICQVLPQTNKWRKIQYNAQIGLSSGRFETLAQDTDGYMWFGADNGLNRFDGINVKVYQTSLNDSNSINDNYINCIFSDSKGRLLVGTAKGVSEFNRLTDNFTRIKAPKEKSITCILEDKHGNFWFSSSGEGLFYLSSNFELKHHFKINTNSINGLKSNHLWSLYQDKEGIIWIGSQEGYIYSYDVITGEILLNSSIKCNDIVRSFFEDKKGNFIVCTNSGAHFCKKVIVWLNSKKTIELQEIDPVDKSLSDLLTVSQCFYGYDNNLWFIHEHGISFLNLSTNKVTHSNSDSSPLGFLYDEPSK